MTKSRLDCGYHVNGPQFSVRMPGDRRVVMLNRRLEVVRGIPKRVKLVVRKEDDREPTD